MFRMSQPLIANDDRETLPDIDSFLQPTHDEFARQRAIAVLHSHAMLNLRFDVRKTFERNAAPKFEREHGHPPRDGREVAERLKDDLFFKFYSAIRYNAQEMGPVARQPAVERALP